MTIYIVNVHNIAMLKEKLVSTQSILLSDKEILGFCVFVSVVFLLCYFRFLKFFHTFAFRTLHL